MCADELAVQATGKRMTYASVLELLGRRRLNLPTPQLAAGIGGRRMALFDRVRNVLGVAPGHEQLRWWPAGLLALLVPVGIWAGAFLSAAPPTENKKTRSEPLKNRESLLKSLASTAQASQSAPRP